MKDAKAKPLGGELSLKEKDRRHLNNERQKRYRERALKDPDGLGYTRLQVMISANADGCLSRVCAATGMTKREAIEKALIDLEARIQDITECDSALAERNATL